jgi:general secretion pathway protein A
MGHYRLKDNPFADAVNLDYYFRTSSQQEAYQKMYHSIHDGISLGMVTGPSGSGKTIVSQLLLEHLDPGTCRTILVLVTPRMGKTVLLREILRETGAESLPARSRDLLELLHRAVIDLHRQDRRLVILIDEAHFLSPEALHMLRTISNLEVPKKKLSTTLLFAEETFRRRLTHPSYRSLSTRMYHRASLAAMSEDETTQYINFRLMVAGGSPDLLDKGAHQAIFAKSGGICREVNRLCYLALMEGFLKNRPAVTADLVSEH